MGENTPVKKFRAGAISATIWQNQGKGRNGDAVEFNTVQLQRSYKDGNGEWQHANTLRVNDLPKAGLLLAKAYEYLVLKKADTGATGAAVEDIATEEEILA